MKSFVRLVLLVLVLLTVALFSALTAMRFAIHGREVAVPKLIGLTPAEAERSVSALGPQIMVERQYYSPAPWMASARGGEPGTAACADSRCIGRK